MGTLRVVGKGLRWGLALVVLGVGALYAQTQWTLTRKVPPPARDAVAVGNDSATLARGVKLTQAYGCQECHAANLGGQVMADDAAFGRLVSSNLTSGAGGVLSKYDDRALDAAIRDGVGWDGRKLLIMPSHEFAAMADDDVGALIANLRRRPPVDHELPRTSLGPVGRGLIAAGKIPVAYDVIDHARTTRPTAPTGGTIEQGRYLAAGCVGCHGKDYGGGPLPGAPADAKPAANLTASGNLGRWSESEFVKALHDGVRPDGTTIDPSMPWKAIGKLSDEELQAIYRYLKTLPPKTVAAP